MTSGYPWLADAVSVNATVITASRRLARELQAAFEQEQRRAGHRSWPTPHIEAFTDWLATALDGAEQQGLQRLIDPAASGLLWERCLGETSRQDLLSTAGVLRHARQAWQRMHDWRIPVDTVTAAASSRDEHWFVRAASAYQNLLRAGGWIDQAQLTEYCADVLQGAQLAPGKRIYLAGFDRLTPVQGYLFEQLAAVNIETLEVPVSTRVATRRYRSYANEDAQWRAAGRWARDQLQRDPRARIAVIVPNLEQDAAAIARKVREGFAAGWQLAGSTYRSAVNVSYGQRLSAFSAIVAAEKALRFAANGLRGQDISLLLRSPFFGQEDMPGRCRLETQLRSLVDRHWQPGNLLNALNDTAPATDGAVWRGRMQLLVDVVNQQDEQLAPAIWAERIDALLSSLGWPGIQQSDSEEFQLINRWRQLLNEFARLGSVRSVLTFREAVGYLFQMAGETLYQPETPAGGLSLMGLLESAGLEFDQVWVGNMDASRWPSAGQPLALLSRQLQRDTGMPDATPADTLAFAERTLDRLGKSTAQLLYSWSRSDGDTELQPSPLLKLDTNSAIETDAGDPGWFACSMAGRAKLGMLHPDSAPPVLPDEKIRGGAYTVQRMQEEPFSAFVAGRLAADTLEPYQAGLTPRLRGIALHDALYRLLLDKPSRSQLQGWTAAQREERSERAAWLALTDMGKQADDILRLILQFEKRRVQQILLRFLDEECARDDFSIDALEERLQLKHGAVVLNMRIDRIDRLEDQSFLVIDYKSGTRKTFMNAKKGVPANVQLSVYARTLAAPIGGLALINLDSREISYQGEGAGVPFGRIKAEDWPQALASWCAEVDALLVRFAGGETGVNGNQSADDGRPLALLSRIEELRRED